MNDLMSANLFRLKRDKVFWICAGALLILSATVLLNGCRQYRDMWAEGYRVDLARCFFQPVPAIGMCVAVFAGLFLGTDHSEGALRNRLMVGHSREGVYLAGLYRHCQDLFSNQDSQSNGALTKNLVIRHPHKKETVRQLSLSNSFFFI